MNLRKLIFTKPEVSIRNKKITVKGVCVHSTGANNPNLRRYVGPDDGLLGNNPNNNHWNVYHPGGRDIGPHALQGSSGACSACGGRQTGVHAWIGKLADGSIATYQVMPWDIESWHGGSGPKGRVNDTHIGFEIAEDSTNDKAYFDLVYKEACEFVAYLCKEFKLNPLADGVVICHAEAYKRGIGSNHGDILHWWVKFGKNMDTFRQDVNKLMSGTVITAIPAPAPAATVTPSEIKVNDIVQFAGGGVPQR